MTHITCEIVIILWASGSSSKMKVLSRIVTASNWSMKKLLKVSGTKIRENKQFWGKLSMKTTKTLFYLYSFSWHVLSLNLCFVTKLSLQAMARKTSTNVNSFQRFWKKFSPKYFFPAHTWNHLLSNRHMHEKAWKLGMSQPSDNIDRRKGKGCEWSQGQECKEEWEASEKIKVSVQNWQRSMGIYLFQWLWFQKADWYESLTICKGNEFSKDWLERGWLPRKEWWYNEEAGNGQLIFHNVSVDICMHSVFQLLIMQNT